MSKKRGNSEGSIYRTKAGLWRGAYTVYTDKGIKRKYVSGKTRKEVSEKLSKALSDRDRGLFFDSEGMNVAEYLDRWLSESVRGTVRESTFASYKQYVDKYLKTGIGRVRLKDLKPAHLRKLYRDRLNSGLSTRTVGYMHSIVKKALKDAVRMEMIPRNLADAVDPPKLKRKQEIRPLSVEQVRKLLEAVYGERLEAAFTVAVHTGVRPGELVALRWEDVDLEAEVLQVKRALSGGEFGEPKTAKSRRRINLSPSARDALRAHRKRQLAERLEKAGLWEDHDLVFPSSVGTPLTSAT